jgi:threonine synthase
MRYFSTNRNSPSVTFREAVELGQPRDRGLYFPSEIPQLAADFLVRVRDMSNDEIAFEMIRPYVAGEISDDELFQICAETVNFPFPLVEITPGIYALELFHGPTLAFKDVGARFMSRCLRFFSKERSKKTLIIVATSGDTGAAVASGFEGIQNMEVVILFPKGRVSRVQELQLTAVRDKVTTLEVLGNFDQCQGLAKQALADAELRKSVFLTSANSINVARWLPQQFYYAFALKRWQGEPPVISVPSGNFGNIAAGVLAHASGLPIKRFIAACNTNDPVSRLLARGHFEPRPSIQTLSNAMDVGDPSNLPRVLEMFGHDVAKMKGVMTAVSISDDKTAETMRQVFAEHGYVLDPHGAVGYRALEEFLENRPQDRGIFLETAHPAKFESVKEIIGNYGVTPHGIDGLPGRPKQSTTIEPDYEKLREILSSKV